MTRRAKILFSLVFFLFFARLGVLFPALYFYYKEIGFNLLQIGTLSAVGGIIVICFSQFWGYLSDVVFGRRPILVFGLACSSVLFICLYPLRNFYAVLVVISLMATLRAPLMGLTVGYVLATPGGPKSFGLIRGWGSVGFAVTALVFGSCVDRSPLGLALMFPVYTVLSLILLALVFFLPADERSAKAKEFNFGQVQRFFFADRRVLVFLAMIVVYYVGQTFPNHMASLILKERGAGLALVGFAFGIAALPEAPLFFVINRLVARVGLYRLFAFSMAVCVFRWLVIGFTDSVWPVVMVMPLASITFGMFYLCAVKYIDLKTPQELKSSGQTLLSMTLFGLAFFLSHQIGGVLAQTIGLRAVYPVAAACVVASAALLFVLHRVDPRP
ncbi:MFS transporter [Candidatus Sumerlaeota bacterium]